STWNVLYDNHYDGFMTAMTTQGTASAVIRASGPAGKHTIDLFHGGKSLPYLNWEQSPQGDVPVYHVNFAVTTGSAVAPFKMDWPRLGSSSPSAATLPQGAVR